MSTNIIHPKVDVLVIGGGIAGTLAAINARETGADVLLVDKSFFGTGGAASLASGAYQVYLPDEDNPNDQLKGRGDLVNQEVALRVIKETYTIYRLMEEWGVEFVKESGKMVRFGTAGIEGQTRVNAGLVGGGPKMMMALRAATLKKGVKVVERVLVNDLLTSEGELPTRGRVVGGIGCGIRDAKVHVFQAKVVVMAAGGYNFVLRHAGQPLAYNPLDNTGDGVAAMHRAGAVLGDLALGGLKIHPLEFWCAPGLEHFTGQGAKWVNRLGEHFMDSRYGKTANINVRYSVPVAMLKENIEGRGPSCLDLRHLTPDQIRLLHIVLPIVMSNFERAGYNLSKEAVPYFAIVAGTHGVNAGGAVVDESGKTSVQGLYAAGACTDGTACRLNLQLSESAVLGWWAGAAAAKEAAGTSFTEINDNQVSLLQSQMLEPLHRKNGPTYEEVHDKVSQALINLGNVLSNEKLERTLSVIRDVLRDDLANISAEDSHRLSKVIGLKNSTLMAEVSLMFLLHRQESRARVINVDYPYTDNENWFNLTRAQLDGNRELRVWDEPVPDSWSTVRRPKRSRSLHPIFSGLSDPRMLKEEMPMTWGVPRGGGAGILPEINVNAQACTGCGVCVDICPTDVLRLDRDKKAYSAYPESCQSCFLCEFACSYSAIRVYPKRWLKA